ncbi:MAG: 2-oxoacid:ferredoxin oxidoreductase subunit beta [Planctomycetota bacterium]|nr:2-oxoacid:ferredoxin oxidoreductase subunit beta [Planctomycetota bacterium]
MIQQNKPDEAAKVELPTLSAKDFTTDQDVRWCPGCGDYAVLAAVRKTLPKLGRNREDYVFVSGIGCAARFPYYMETYGLHSIHGRAPAFASGIKLANPELDVWLVSGDGDLLSIGGNHLIHSMRRNVGINLILLNNRIYGLTKGQYSPTSERGKITKSTPMGSLDTPINPIALALAAECTFVARSLDIDAKFLEALMTRGAGHQGMSFIEVYQDCNIYNHKAWFYASQKDSRPETTVLLEHEKPLIFGTDRDKGIRIMGGRPEVVTIGEDGVTESDLMVHDETSRVQASILSHMYQPEFPEPMGVIFVDSERPSYEGASHEQMVQAHEQHPDASLEALVKGRQTWTID